MSGIGIDWSLADPDAMYKGAANMNTMLQRYAMQRAGHLANQGDDAGVVKTLNEAGNLDGASAYQNAVMERKKQFQALDKQKQAESTQMLVDIAHVLGSVQQKDGDQAAVQAFEQMVPMFKQRGATDEEIETYRQGLQRDPAGFIQSVGAAATAHMQSYDLSPGAQRRDGMNNVVAEAPAAPVYRDVAPGHSVVNVPGNQPQYQVGKVYKDKAGNRAKWDGQQFVAVE